MTQSLRSLLKNPGFTIIALSTLALGIGANTAIFSVVNGVLLRPLPYPDAERIVQVWTTSAETQEGSYGPADFLELQRRTQTLAKFAGYREDALTIAPEGTDPVRETGALVTLDYFDVLGSAAMLGRTFAEADARQNEPVAIISFKTWRDTLASDPSVVGRRLRINSVSHTVLGVMPDGFDYPLGARTWILSAKPVPPPPLDVGGDLLAQRSLQYFLAVGRLKPGSTVAQAQAELTGIAADMAPPCRCCC